MGFTFAFFKLAPICKYICPHRFSTCYAIFRQGLRNVDSSVTHDTNFGHRLQSIAQIAVSASRTVPMNSPDRTTSQQNPAFQYYPQTVPSSVAIDPHYFHRNVTDKNIKDSTNTDHARLTDIFSLMSAKEMLPKIIEESKNTIKHQLSRHAGGFSLISHDEIGKNDKSFHSEIHSSIVDSRGFFPSRHKRLGLQLRNKSVFGPHANVQSYFMNKINSSKLFSHSKFPPSDKMSSLKNISNKSLKSLRSSNEDASNMPKFVENSGSEIYRKIKENSLLDDVENKYKGKHIEHKIRRRVMQPSLSTPNSLVLPSPKDHQKSGFGTQINRHTGTHLCIADGR